MTSLRRTGQRMQNSTHSYPQYQMDVSDQLDAAITLPGGKMRPVPSGQETG